MHWLQSLDAELFRFINSTLVNPVLDVGMPLASHNALFGPLVLLSAVLLVWKGRARGVLCVLMLAVILPLGDGMVCNTIKHAIARPRPYAALPDVHRPGSNANSDSMAPAPSSQPGQPATAVVSSALTNALAASPSPPLEERAGERRPSAPRPLNSTEVAQPTLLSYPPGSLTSMPSSHAANWFAATMILFIYYRRSVWFMLPAALVVGFSRIYNGVHYPGDVLVGAVLGAGYAAAGVWSLNALWQWAGRKWFPLWWTALPSLLAPPLRTQSAEDEEMPPADSTPHATVDQHWLRLGYVWIAACLLARLAYIASRTIQLSQDESYQWLWSKHLALSYYSKPPLIAYTQFLGTSLWGDNAFGIRFFAPVIAAILSFLLLRFLAREVNARAGFFLLLIISASPLLSVGGVLMTIDPLSVLFWTAAMLAGWRAIQPDAPTRPWLWVGLWMGLGFLSKYTELFQLLCWAVFFTLWPPARKHLRRPGPYLALLLNVLCALPVLIWNAQHQWITVSHVADDAGVHSAGLSTLKYVGEFLGAEAGLLNPVFFVATVWAAIAFWRRSRHNPRLVYFFSMGAPIFLAYLVHSFHGRVLPNWIAPSVLPLFCLMVIYWDTKWRLGAAKLKPWLIAGLSLGFVLVVLAHDTNLITKATGWPLPVNQDPLHRVREWSEVARVVGDARKDLLAEGKPVFIIAAHYGLVGEISFYLPEARETVAKEPLVFCQTSPTPENQFFFWPSYMDRKGQNAVFVRELDRDRTSDPPVPPTLEQQFESVTLLGVRDVLYHGRVLRPLQLYACRGLR